MESISEAICFDPFEDDFGEPGDRTLKDKIVKFRKPHRCHICGTTTTVGEVGRSRVDVFEGKLYSFYFCHECCVAMVTSLDDCEDETLIQRYALGEERRDLYGHS
ncbi:MAG: hypothetical protein ACRC4V_03330 [Aeromonas veronii]